MTQAHSSVAKATNDTVKLRVTSKRYVEAYNKIGKITKREIVEADWLTNKVKHNGTIYEPGQEFEVKPVMDNGRLIKPAKVVAEELVATGCVQLASSKPVTYMPPSIDRPIELTNGIQMKADVEGMIPTRTEAGQEPGWVEPAPEEDDDYEAGY